MTRNFILFYLLIIPIIFSSCQCKKTCCTSIPQYGNWVSVTPFQGSARTEAVAFVISNYAYVGTGIDNLNNRYNDLYKFDPSNLSWSQVASCAGMKPRNSAVAFNTNGKGYVGTGFDGKNALSDFWQYDPVANSWAQKASLGDSNGLKPRYNAVAFGIGNNGYVSTGNDSINFLKDVWQYDAIADKWTKKIDFPGSARDQAVSFVYNNKGYIVTGLGTNGTTLNDFYSFDPSKPDASAWSQLRYISNFSPNSYDDGYISIVRYNAVGFVMTQTVSDGGGDRAYITTGSAGSTTWAYNFATDLWNQKTSYEREARSGAVGFSVLNRGFVGLGTSGSSAFSNFDEWKPDQVYNHDD